MHSKEIQTRPNHQRILFVLFLIILIVAYTVILSFMLISIFLTEIKNSNYAIFYLLPVILFSLLTLVIIKILIGRVNYVIGNIDGMKIIYPLIFKTVFLEWNQIKGYSKSDYYFGEKFLLKSKSIVIYTKSRQIFEIIEIYNLDFTKFQSDIRKFQIVCFGTEKYTTKSNKIILSKRHYKYDEMFN